MPRMLDLLASVEERSAEASRFAMFQQKERIEERTSAGRDVDGQIFSRTKTGKKPKVAGKNLLSTVEVQSSPSFSGSEASLRSFGKASVVLAAQNRLRRFFGFGPDDRAKVAGDYVGKLLGR